ncbi:type IV secretion system protein [Massilia pinisoli]|uniref:Type IV secretion system protein n=1 Tax=Massilia pinisoli TaxID=1772194 RepID=A0ABT1ZZQ4_9BURK|nr:type IV secretion system protein [Massilia pinisoli]MCS0585422.1 type IV secretion system protein [Massilia pinisoli]
MQTTNARDALAVHVDELRRFIETHDDIQLLLEHSAAESDRRTDVEQRSRRTAWRVAAGASMLAIAAFAIAAGAIHTSMRPAPPPEVLVVDKSTGATRPLMSLAAYQLSPEEATIRRSIATFLRAREGYTFDTAEDSYYDAAAFMSPRLQAQWAAYWDTANPASPMNVYKKDGKVRVQIGAITILRNGLGAATGVRVSFTSCLSRADQPAGEAASWIATIPFHWVNVATDERTRRVNDLGMEITDYIKDPDLGVAAPAMRQPEKAAPVLAGQGRSVALSAPVATAREVSP